MTQAFRLSARQLASSFAGPFDFDVEAGACIVIQGSSGAGKSVLLRMLADLDPHSGQALLDGQPAQAMTAPAWRARVLYQAAEPAWWEASPGAHFDGAQLEWASNQLAALGLRPDILDDELQHLSTGERQRLALLRSLARKPQVLLLDEPTAALDPDGVARVEAMLAACRAEGLTIIMVSHSPEQARRIATRVWRVEGGKLADVTGHGEGA
ncbi:ATP-binding cassette domain-containing protein [Massilia sp. 9096]|uniref:ABC transporter ATP-binding protein n=1 Tax=Massilia sp. 9096 TaxID=1500894 RepID=UPI0018CEBB06|nr:ABC transporter ATP-binding protein [Massilia sp. 9096]